MQIWGEAGHPVSKTSFIIRSIPLHYLSAPILQTPVSLYQHHSPSNATFSTISGNIPIHGLPRADKHPLFFVAVFASIGLGGVAIFLLMWLIQAIGSLRASRLLFSELLDGIVRATMRWHDTTPTGKEPSDRLHTMLMFRTGRILNRFQKDVEVLDSSLSNSVREFLRTATLFVAAIVTLIGAWPGFLVLGPIITYAVSSYSHYGPIPV